MNWLFELSAACALIALALPFAWKFLPSRPVLQPAPVRAKPSPQRPSSADQDPRA